jgi:predicted DNA-binding protein with PD1-like motif
MKSRLIHEVEGERTIVLVFDTDDEVMTLLTRYVRENKFGSGRFSAIGAFRDVTLGFYNWESKEYRRIPVKEQVEVLSLIGDVAVKGGEPAVHAHVVLGTSDGSAHGGHLLEAHVRPTLEMILTQTPAHLRKEIGPDTGLALIRL